MIDHRFEKDSGILYIYFKGEIFREEIIDHINQLKSMSNLPRELRLLYDLTEAELRVSSTEIKSLSHFAENSLKHYPSIRTAFLVDKPLETALLSIFVDMKTRFTLNRKIFSTLDAARTWVLL